ncbi:CNP1-like family protein [Parvibium lacunae]|uniref:CNP1-like uncharacterized domain-containing protein n=1 Tax=Parvibium lacunae TaxID=1888893 RepID=A0A368L2X0_9BURK|nr:CNP1-like family protein [Parvibium lacunae]RCS57458.1 hypothetical protein DU000_08350 [Parvibium lacunae]
MHPNICHSFFWRGARLFRLAAVIFSASIALSAYGQTTTYSYKEPVPTFQEAPVNLPATPDDSWQTLVLQIMPTGVATYQINLTSLQIGADRVVRFVWRHIAPSGAATLTYEGIHCNLEEKGVHRKVYGFFSPSTGWFGIRQAQWQPLLGNKTLIAHQTLAQESLCRDTPSSNPTDTLREALRRQTPSRIS